MSDAPHELTAELVFRRLEELSELLRLTDYLREYRPLAEGEPELSPREIGPSESPAPCPRDDTPD